MAGMRSIFIWHLSPRYSASLCKISLKSNNRLLSYGQKNWKWRPSAILNFKNFHIWSCDCHRVPNLHSYTKFHRNRMIIVAIHRFAIGYDVRALSWIFEIEFMARDLYHRAILLPCAKCHKYHRNDSTSACIIHFIYILVFEDVIGSKLAQKK